MIDGKDAAILDNKLATHYRVIYIYRLAKYCSRNRI